MSPAEASCGPRTALTAVRPSVPDTGVSQTVVPGPAASLASRSLLAMKILGFQLTPSEPEALVWGPTIWALTSFPRDFDVQKSENHCPTFSSERSTHYMESP